MVEIDIKEKKFGSKLVLQNINLSLNSNKIYGLVGLNGAGKTTLFRCISNMYSFNGSIQCSDFELSKKVGFLPAEIVVPEFVTCREYIEYCIHSRDTNQQIEWHNIFDLPMEEYVSRFSTGMKKKLLLTAILYQGNDLFILDEPFSGIDVESNYLLSEFLKSLRKKGKYIFLSSHMIEGLRELADEIFVLKNGRIIDSIPCADFDRLSNHFKKIDKFF